MPILRFKNDNGIWEEVAGASVHTHTISDITDLPSSLPTDVEILQELVGDASVEEQIASAISTKADVGHEHNNTLLYTTVSGVEAIYIPDALAGYEMDVKLSSDTYTDFSNMSVSLVADNHVESQSSDANGVVAGLEAKESFTLGVISTDTNFDATKVTITCTYQYDLDKVMQSYVLDVDDVLNGETGDNDYTNNITTHTVIDDSLSITGAAADAKATGDAIKSINSKITNLGSGYTHPSTHPASMITGLATVATSGDYNDLSNQPEIPSIEGLATTAYVDEQIASIDIPSGGGVSSWNDLTDKPFGEENNQIDILPLTRCENFTLDTEGFNLYTHGIDTGCTLTVGENYKCLWDGVEYTCEALDVSSLYGGLPIVAFGNGAAFGFSGNNEPFIVLCNNDNGYLTFACLTHTEPCEYHDVRIYQENTVITKIDPKYLPDSIGGSGNALPEVTTEDNGKILTVVNGVWSVDDKDSSPTSIDLSGFESEGRIVETFADGSTITTIMEFDANGNPTKITDGNGNITVLTW